jgi:hypothetical protein
MSINSMTASGRSAFGASTDDPMIPVYDNMAAQLLLPQADEREFLLQADELKFRLIAVA